MADHAQIEQKLSGLGIVLPEPPKPVASYLPCVVSDDLVIVGGQLPSKNGKVKFCGKVPRDLSMEDGQEAARLALVNGLSVLKTSALDGNWGRLVKILRVGVFVQSENDFYGQPQIANGASDLLVEILGDLGRHARAAVAVNALPLNAAVEVELMVRIAPQRRWRDQR
jgi:enamine deaminase RidA (YjgF/YER057c/UK114 family)